MTVRFPDLNTWATGQPPQITTANGLRLDLPDQAANKPASVAYTLGMFLSVRSGGPRAPGRTWEQVIWGRRFGAGNSGDGGLYLGAENRTNAAANNVLRVNFVSSGTTTVGQPNPIALTNNVPYFVALIVNSTGTWLAACPCGGTAQIQLLNNNSLYVDAMTASQLTAVRTIGSAMANTRCFNGAVSDVFMLRNADFPLNAGAPNLTVIQNIANRSQSINTLQSLFTNGTAQRRFYYRLTSPTDLVDSWGVAPGPLTYNAANVPGANRTLYEGPPLDTNPLKPRQTIDHVSQVTFGTPRDAATAFTTIGTDSGTYTGITPNNIQARLIDAITGAQVYAPRVVDPAPTGGTWAENETAFTNVLMRAGYMLVQYRAYDASNNPLTEWCTAWSLRGAGVNIVMVGQSGAAVPVKGAGSGMTLEPTVLGNYILADGHLPHAGTVLDDAGLQPFAASGVAIGGSSALSDFRKGPGQIMREVDLLHPGVPTTFSFVGDGGMPLAYWRPDRELGGRWQALKDAVGVRQPYIFFHMAHNAGPTSLYNETIRVVYNHMVSIFGAPVRALHTSTGRGPMNGNTPLPNTFSVSAHAGNQELESMLETQQFCEEEAAAGRGSQHWWLPWDETTQSIWEATLTNNDSHTADTLLGGGRWGTTIFYAVASGCRMIPDVPMRIVVKADGNDAVIRFVPDVQL